MEPEIGIFSGRFGAGTKNPKTLIRFRNRYRE